MPISHWSSRHSWFCNRESTWPRLRLRFSRLLNGGLRRFMSLLCGQRAVKLGYGERDEILLDEEHVCGGTTYYGDFGMDLPHGSF